VESPKYKCGCRSGKSCFITYDQAQADVKGKHLQSGALIETLSEECPPSLIRGHLGVALGVEPVAAVFDQRDRAVEVCDYDLRCFHCLHSSSTRSTHSSGALWVDSAQKPDSERCLLVL